jgi:hypothetical protein
MLKDVDEWIKSHPDTSAASYRGRAAYFSMENFRG